MRIGLIVDHPKRDLEGIVRIAYELAKRGAEVVIIPMYYQGVDIPCLGLDAVLVNFARAMNRGLIDVYARAGVKVFVLDTEGGVLGETGGNSPAAFARRIREEGYGPALSGYLFWGGKLRNAFADAGTLPEDRLHVTGCPRFDYAAEPWRALLKSERRGYVLLNTNFPLVNPRFSGSAERERDTSVAAGWERGYMDRLLADFSHVMDGFLATMAHVASLRPRIQFLLRPHPYEDEEPYYKAFGGLANVVIDGTGSVLHQIHNSLAVLHLNCSTAIESVMLGKLPVQLAFLNTEATANHAKLPAKVSRCVHSPEELLSVIDDIEGETSRFPFDVVYREQIHAYFHESDGRAGNRVADVLIREVKRLGGAPHWRSLAMSGRGSHINPSLAQLANGVVSLALGSAATAALRAWIKPARRDKLFTAEEVERILAGLKSCDPENRAELKVSRDRGGLFNMPLASFRVAEAGGKR